MKTAPAIQHPKKTTQSENRTSQSTFSVTGIFDGKINVLQRTAGVPTLSDKELKARAEMMAPALPEAADMPCAEALKRVGKTSAG